MEWIAYGIPTLILLAALVYGASRAGWLTPGERARLDAATRATRRAEEARAAENPERSPEDIMSMQNRERPPPYVPPEPDAQRLQPDPMLRPGPMSGWAKWPVVAAALVLVAMAIYAVANHSMHPVTGAPMASDTTGDRPPAQPLPGGRTTADAPPAPPVSTPATPPG